MLTVVECVWSLKTDQLFKSCLSHMRSRWSYSSTNCDDLIIIVNYADVIMAIMIIMIILIIMNIIISMIIMIIMITPLCLGNACLIKAVTKPTP